MEGSDSSEHSVDQFVILFAKYQRRVHAYIGALLPSRSDAEDVMQETSLALWQKWKTYDPARDFCRWAFGIAHIEVLRHRRKFASSRVFFSEVLIENVAQEILQNPELAEQKSVALMECLQKLGDTDRRLVEHRYRSGVTAVQAATDLGRPLSTVYKALTRIRRLLFECVQRRLAQEAGS